MKGQSDPSTWRSATTTCWPPTSSTTDRLWLVDWEYAGYDSPLFDLANLASNSQFDAAAQDSLLGAYYGAAPDAALRHRLGAMMCASLLREAMWSMTQEIHSGLDVDFAAYTAENTQRFERALETWRAAA